MYRFIKPFCKEVGTYYLTVFFKKSINCKRTFFYNSNGLEELGYVKFAFKVDDLDKTFSPEFEFSNFVGVTLTYVGNFNHPDRLELKDKFVAYIDDNNNRVFIFPDSDEQILLVEGETNITFQHLSRLYYIKNSIKTLCSKL
jgi:hypothetical protein